MLTLLLGFVFGFTFRPTATGRDTLSMSLAENKRPVRECGGGQRLPVSEIS